MMVYLIFNDYYNYENNKIIFADIIFADKGIYSRIILKDK